MSQSYRPLGEGIPGPRGLGGAPFIAEAKRARAWVAALPRANAEVTRERLAQALDNLAGQML